MFLLGIRTGTTPTEIANVLEKLPPEATGKHDEEVQAIVVRVNGNADKANEALRLLSQTELFTAGPGTEEAVLRYLPEKAARPAEWDVSDDFAICITCSWSVSASGQAALEEKIEWHTKRVHAGRKMP